MLLCAGVLLAAISLPGMLDNEVFSGGASFRLIAFGLGSTLVWPVACQLLGVYPAQRRTELRTSQRRLIKLGFGIGASQFAMLYLFAPPAHLSLPLVTTCVQLSLLCLLRGVVFRTSRWIRKSDRYHRNVIILGSGPRAAYVKDIIEQHPHWGNHILGFIDDEEPPGGSCVPREQVFKISDMRGLIVDQVIDEVIVACPRSMLSTIMEAVDQCSAAGVPITLLSDLFGDFLPAPQTTRFGSLPALSFAPVHHSKIKLAIKRGMDIFGAAVGLTLFGPVIGLAALFIKLTSPGPAFFRQVRCGFNGRHFVMYKMRTMGVDAEARRLELNEFNEMDGPVFKMTQDPRITRVGRILRRYSIDELPQFFNVLIGDMSLVGPRPPVPVEVAEYQTFERRRLSMRPGITCLWQVSGRNAIGFDGWVRLDLEYIDTWSLTRDFDILLRTLPAVVSANGAS
ncbi:MAG: exopolysaccharide biosynthesis polyprenyl glycosylphosphotransferase [Myxococcota bacterium]|jgi:exopolysaccharide biosynthesis polyprenyl glycosylphosphotransferase